MSGGVVCYLERDLGGAVLRRVRLVAVGLSRSWDAPEIGPTEPSPDSVSPGASDGSAVASIREAARWVAETLQNAGLRRVSRVCVDADGSLCAWLSAPSPDPAVIRATISHAEQDSGDSASLGAGRLLAMAAPAGTGGIGLAADTSVQALAAPETAEESNGHGPRRSRMYLPGRKNKEIAAPGAIGGAVRRHRYAVITVPDAPVRVFLDELDARGVEVRSVMSLWHAMASAWDEAGGPGSAGAGSPVVASESSTTAIVLTEPGGRLVWAWSRQGELLTGGTIRLKTTVRRSAEATPPGETGDSLAVVDGTRRVPIDEAAPEPEVSLEFSESEAGRLAVDWLAWSAQLGQCPRRVVCIAAPGATDETGQGPAGLGRQLARAWPGATIDAAVYDDPVGATLARLAGVRPDDRGGEIGAAPASDDVAAEEPMSALVSLSARPGRSDRSLHQWVAGGLFAAAVAIGALGWRMGSGAAGILAEERSTTEQMKTTLAGLGSLDPSLPGANFKQALGTLESKRIELRQLANKVRPPRPVLEEVVRVLGALEGQTGIDVTEFAFQALTSASVQINITESPTAAQVGPAILEKLRASEGQLPWDGTTPSFTREPGKRTYILMAMWPADDKPAQTMPAKPNSPAKGGTK